ncbi:NUDIX hydrolase [Streptomyces sp. NPDC006798]|uniref:NUDIX hydrolase n=1 Tax=Streptomyces sp. NPDC006798 TaxID=3155462 RepID=UPI0033F22DBE
MTIGTDERPPAARPAVAVGIVARADGAVLLARRTGPPSGWAFPGGWIEPDETPEIAAVREIREETGLTVTAGAFLGARVHRISGQFIAYVVCHVAQGTSPRPTAAAPAEVNGVIWAPPGTLHRYLGDDVYPPVKKYVTGLPTAADIDLSEMHADVRLGLELAGTQPTGPTVDGLRHRLREYATALMVPGEAYGRTLRGTHRTVVLDTIRYARQIVEDPVAEADGDPAATLIRLSGLVETLAMYHDKVRARL